MKEILHIENLDCPVCAEALQEDLQKIKGVRSAQVDYVSQTITLDVENEKAIAKVVDVANHFEEVRVLEGGRYALTDNSHKKEWIRIGISALVLALGLAIFLFMFLPQLFRRIIEGWCGAGFTFGLWAKNFIEGGFKLLIFIIKNYTSHNYSPNLPNINVLKLYHKLKKIKRNFSLFLTKNS